MSSSVTDLFEWTKAIQNWRYGQPEYLASLIGEADVPPILRMAIAKIISGEMQQTRRGIGNQKITPADRLSIALEVRQRKYHHIPSDEERMEFMLDAGGRRRHHAGLDDVANKWGVSVASIRNFEGEARKLMHKWPDF